MSFNLYPNSTLVGVVSHIAPLSTRERSEIVGGLAKRVHGVFASRKNHRSLPWRTHEEQDLFRLLEVDSSVHGFQAMPERVTYEQNGQHRSHVPAARAFTKHGSVVLDAFPDHAMDRRTKLIRLLTDVYADRGIPYRALSSKSLRLLPRMDNAKHVLAHRCLHVPAGVDLAIQSTLTGRDSLTIGEIAQELGHIADIAGVVCAMAIDGDLVLNLSALAPSEMRVSLPGARS